MSEVGRPNGGPPSMLRLRGVDAFYGPLQALHGVDLDVAEGTVTCVLGANGAGKSTLLASIMGLLGRESRGEISLAGEHIDRLATERIVRLGVGFVPEARRVFPELSVRDNLRVGGYVVRDRARLREGVERAYRLFPRLAERRDQAAGTLSGGEQQMLAIGRALVAAPRLLLLDEPSLGLAPALVEQLFEIVAHIRDDGVTVLLVEQNARMALGVSDRGVVLDRGRVVVSESAASLIDNPRVEELYMGSARAGDTPSSGAGIAPHDEESRP